MPLCIDTYRTSEKYLTDKDILVRKRICQIYMKDEDETFPYGEPELVNYTVSMRTPKTLKTAYIRLSGSVGGFDTVAKHHGYLIEEKPLPEPFAWNKDWLPLEKLLECDDHQEIEQRIKEEFGIHIWNYLGVK